MKGIGGGSAFWAQKLVDNVSSVTKLDVYKDELQNVEDWQSQATKLFEEVIRAAVEAERERIACMCEEPRYMNYMVGAMAEVIRERVEK